MTGYQITLALGVYLGGMCGWMMTWGAMSKPFDWFGLLSALIWPLSASHTIGLLMRDLIPLILQLSSAGIKWILRKLLRIDQ